MKLILFDIDGTILQIGNQGRRSVEVALSSLLGRSVTAEGVRFAGRTDVPILKDVLAQSGLTPGEVKAWLPRCVDAYVSHMLVRLDGSSSVSTLPGVGRLVALLHDRSDVQLGILTGNVQAVAWSKLAAVGMRDYFPFGAFGDDADFRDQLPAIAVDRAFDHMGHCFSRKDIVIVGDTEYDISCGRSLGVMSVAVSTGRYDRAYLASFKPDVLLDDLSDTVAFDAAVFVD